MRAQTPVPFLFASRWSREPVREVARGLLNKQARRMKTTLREIAAAGLEWIRIQPAWTLLPPCALPVPEWSVALRRRSRRAARALAPLDRAGKRRAVCWDRIRNRPPGHAPDCRYPARPLLENRRSKDGRSASARECAPMLWLLPTRPA